MKVCMDMALKFHLAVVKAPAELYILTMTVRIKLFGIHSQACRGTYNRLPIKGDTLW